MKGGADDEKRTGCLGEVLFEAFEVSEEDERLGLVDEQTFAF